MGLSINYCNFKLNLIFFTIILSSIFQLPEISAIVKNFGLHDNYWIYIFRLFSILSSIYLINKYKSKLFYIKRYNLLFALYYSIIDIYSFSDINYLLIFSIIWKLSAIISFMIIANFFLNKYFYWNAIGWILVITGIIITGGYDLSFSNVIYNLNIFLILGILILLNKNNTILFLLLVPIILCLYVSSNRTLIAIIIISFFIIYLLNFKYLEDLKIINFTVIICLMIGIPIIILIEGNTWFAYSIFTGRAEIWLYWIDFIHQDFFRYIFGVKINSPEFLTAVYVGNSSLGYDFTDQFHSGFISLFVKGGITLFLLFIIFIIKELKINNLNIFNVLTFVAIILFLSLNTNFDFFYPNLYGFLLIAGLGSKNIYVRNYK